jgi:hypothetical protein
LSPSLGSGGEEPGTPFPAVRFAWYHTSIPRALSHGATLPILRGHSGSPALLNASSYGARSSGRRRFIRPRGAEAAATAEQNELRERRGFTSSFNAIGHFKACAQEYSFPFIKIRLPFFRNM